MAGARRVKVVMAELEFAFDNSSDEIGSFLDLETGEVIDDVTPACLGTVHKPRTRILWRRPSYGVATVPAGGPSVLLVLFVIFAVLVPTGILGWGLAVYLGDARKLPFDRSGEGFQ